MSEKARKEILAKIRRTTERREFVYDRGAVEASLDPRPGGRTLAEHVVLFEKRQRELGGQVHLASTVNGLVEILSRRLAAVADGPVWVEQGLAVGGKGVLPKLRDAGLADVREALEPEGEAQWKQLLADAAVGVTGADWLLAETGSVVLVHRRGRPRMLSLLPRHHFVVSSVSQLVPNLDEVIPLLDRVHQAADFAAVTIVTGSSRTADIEKILIKGVHGPQNLEVFLLAET